MRHSKRGTMSKEAFKKLASILLLGVILLTACGGATTTATSEPTDVPAPTRTIMPSDTPEPTVAPTEDPLIAQVQEYGCSLSFQVTEEYSLVTVMIFVNGEYVDCNPTLPEQVYTDSLYEAITTARDDGCEEKIYQNVTITPVVLAFNKDRIVWCDEPPTPEPNATRVVTQLNPGDKEIKSIDESILDGGAVQYFGNTMTDSGSKSDGTWHYTENRRELVFYRENNNVRTLLADPHTKWALGQGVRYFRYIVPETVDLVQLIQEIEYILPNARFTKVLYGIKVEQPRDDFLSVEYDYVHKISMPSESFTPAIQYKKLSNGESITFDGWMLITTTCEGSKAKTQYVVESGFTSQCDMKEGSFENVYFINNGDKESPRAGTQEENARLMWYLMKISKERAGEAVFGIERFMVVDDVYAGWYPYEQFATVHTVITPTNTATVTPTRTPQATHTQPATASATSTP